MNYPPERDNDMLKKILAALLVLGAVFSLSWYLGVRQRLANEARLAQASPVPMPTAETAPAPAASTAPASPGEVLKNASKVHKSGTKKLCKQVFGIETCANTDWTIDVAAEGPPAITRKGDMFHVAVPIRFDGEAGASSEEFKGLKVENRKFSGAVDAWADVGINPADGCTITQVATGFEWREEPQIELVGGMQVKVGNLVKNQFDKILQDTVNSLKAAASCEIVKREIERLRQNGGG